MSALVTNFEPTMSSMQIVDAVNEERMAKAEAGGKRFIRLAHRSFMAKVPNVLGQGCAKFFAHHINPDNHQEYGCYNFPKREACLMAMSYSYDIQAKVFDRMVELEGEFEGSQLTTVSERMPLFHFALHGLDRFGISLPVMYRAISNAAGCTNFRYMLRRHLAVVLPTISRIRSGAGSQADWTALHVHRPALAGGQLEIDFAELSAYNPTKEAS